MQGNKKSKKKTNRHRSGQQNKVSMHSGVYSSQREVRVYEQLSQLPRLAPQGRTGSSPGNQSVVEGHLFALLSCLILLTSSNQSLYSVLVLLHGCVYSTH